MAADFSIIKDERLHAKSVEFSKASLKNGAAGTVFSESRISLRPKGMPGGKGVTRFWFRDCEFLACDIVGEGVVAGLDLTSGIALRNSRFSGGPFVDLRVGLNMHEFGLKSTCERVCACDFSDADLRGARFYGVDRSEVVLPKWPHITVQAKDGATVLVPTLPHNREQSELLVLMRRLDGADSDLRVALAAMVFGVSTASHGASISVSHADDIVRYGAGSLERLREALDRIGHPAIRY